MQLEADPHRRADAKAPEQAVRERFNDDRFIGDTQSKSWFRR
jgi:hypothetical protein